MFGVGHLKTSKVEVCEFRGVFQDFCVRFLIIKSFSEVIPDIRINFLSERHKILFLGHYFDENVNKCFFLKKLLLGKRFIIALKENGKNFSFKFFSFIK